MIDLEKLSVSVVIPSYNGKSLLEKNLNKVIIACPRAEIIIVDDASCDNTVEFIQENFPLVKILKNYQNLRFAQTVNRGVKESNGNIIILLNNDVSPKSNFLEPLLRNFQDQKIFSVGCKEIQITDGKEYESGRNIGYFKKGLVMHQKAKTQNNRQTFWNSGGSMAFRKSIFYELGGFDHLYYPAYWEDIDLSYRAQKRGYKVVFEPQSIVYHNHETTHKKVLGQDEIEITAFKNQILFVWKNITDSNLILLHCFWFPYHVIFTSIKTKGKFLKALPRVVRQLPQIFKKRRYESNFTQVYDKILLNINDK